MVLAVAIVDSSDAPKARRGPCASEPADSAQEKALAADQTHLWIHNNQKEPGTDLK